MIRRRTGRLGIDPAEIAQIELLDKGVDHPDWTILDDPVLQAFGKQRALTAIDPFDEALHPIPRNPWRIIPRESNEAMRFHTARVKISKVSDERMIPGW